MVVGFTTFYAFLHNGAGKAAKQIEKIAVTSSIDFSIQHAIKNG